jgi:hypothetical protein
MLFRRHPCQVFRSLLVPDARERPRSRHMYTRLCIEGAQLFRDSEATQCLFIAGAFISSSVSPFIHSLLRHGGLCLMDILRLKPELRHGLRHRPRSHCARAVSLPWLDYAEPPFWNRISSLTILRRQAGRIMRQVSTIHHTHRLL